MKSHGQAGTPRSFADGLYLPPLQKTGSVVGGRGLGQMKLPGGADQWTIPQVSLVPRSARFREWVAQSPMELEQEMAAWGTNRNLKTMRPKFQSAFSAKASAAPSKRSKSAISGIRAVYLGARDEADDISIGGKTSATADDNTRLQQELAQIRNGDDAVKYFARHGHNSKIKVLYCNRLPVEEATETSPFSLVVVPEHKVKPEHFTISANGVFHVCPGEMSECIPLSEWMHHGIMSSVLRAMPFFKLYAFRKNFHFWRSGARHEAFCRQRQQLSRKCFFAKPLFVKPLAKMGRLANDVKDIPLLRLSQDCTRLGDFSEAQSSVRSNSSTGARIQLERKQEAMLSVIEGLIASVQRALSEASRDVNSSTKSAKSKSMVQEKQDARDRAKRCQFVEHDLKSIGSFIRLAEYMFQGARVESVLDAVSAFHQRLDSSQRMFVADAFFTSHDVALSPSSQEFSEELQKLWGGILQTVNSVPRISAAAPLQKWVDSCISDLTVAEIIGANDVYRERVNHVEGLIFDQLHSAHQIASEQYLRFHHIYEFGLMWDEEEVANQKHTIESLSKQILRMDEFKAELSQFRAHRAVGIIYVHGAQLRSILDPVPERALLILRQRLVSLTREKCSVVSQMLDTMIKGLDDKPTASEMERASAYNRLVDSVESQLPKLVDVVDEVDSARHVMTQQALRVSMEDQLSYEMLHTRLSDLEQVKLPQAKAHRDTLFPDLVVTVHVAPGEKDDWSLTCVSMSGSELTQVNMNDVVKVSSKDLKSTLADRLGVPSSRLVLLQADGRQFCETLAEVNAQVLSKRRSSVNVQAVVSEMQPLTLLQGAEGGLFQEEGDDDECNRF
mmetsp:Transcript_39288/g.61234  ORF Transcript_39288/g.61234 Transcript_39288/m.61234 type:complete len:843 (-) Transcript_39288:165-2693(-)